MCAYNVQHLDASGVGGAGGASVTTVENELDRARVMLAQQGRQASLIEPTLLSQQLGLHCSQLETLSATALGSLLGAALVLPVTSAPPTSPLGPSS